MNHSKDCESTFFDVRLHGFPNHDVQRDILLLALQINLSNNLEPKFAVNNWVDIIRALEVASPAFDVSLEGSSKHLNSYHMFINDLPSL